MYGSSGQTGSPLYSYSPKDMISLIALMVNATDSRVIITTTVLTFLLSQIFYYIQKRWKITIEEKEKPVIPRSITIILS